MQPRTGPRLVVRSLLLFGAVASLLTAWLPAARSFDVESTDLTGFATGSVAAVELIEGIIGPETRLADAQVAFSGAVVEDDPDGLAAQRVNEVETPFQPELDQKHTYARGSGLEVGLAHAPPADPQVILASKSQADAPPDSTDQDQLVSLDADPLAAASVLRSNASARWNDSGLVAGVCVLGDDISRGYAYAADVELLDTDGAQGGGETLDAPLLALNDPDPQRSVSFSTSRTRLVPVPGGKWGLMSEVRETIAPIRFLGDDDDDPTTDPRTFTIEIAGEWVLRVIATGSAGGATVHYGPADASPNTSLIRFINPDGSIEGELTTQMLFGEEGLVFEPVPQLISLSVGTDPRAISAPGAPPDPDSKPAQAADGTSASAAVDVLRLRLLDQPEPEGAELRVGHMEVSAQVPAGGIDCGIPVTKSADPPSIIVGGDPDTTTVTITVTNPYTCELNDVVLTDEIRQEKFDPDFKILSGDPTPESPPLPTGVLTTADVLWELGSIPAKSEKVVTLDIQAATSGGIIRDIATATGVLGACDPASAAVGISAADVSLTGSSVAELVEVEVAATGPRTSSTVATGIGLAALATGAAFLARRRRPAA